jgi:phosphoribosyl 1,2-cyclic phosphate phosphodiesterase
LTITFLGTGTSQGVPVIGCDCDVCRSADARDNRLRTSVHVSTQGKSLVIDTGPDFRQQMLREKVRRLDAVVFTHQHRDHLAGLDDVRSFNFLQQRAMPIYGNAQVIEQIKREYHYVFGNDYPGIPQIVPHLIENKPFMAAGLPLLPIEVRHHKLPVFGFRIGDFSYITDANFISDTEMEKLRGTRVLVLNALQREKHISHFNLQEALQMVKKVKPEKAYFTHMGHRMGLHAEVNAELPEGVALAHDGLKVEL